MRMYLSMKFDEVKERFSGDKDERERIDTNLPFNLRVGSRVQISEAPFLLAGEETHVKYPGPEVLINAFSNVDLAGLKTVRLYVESRDDPDESAMLMLLVDGKNISVNEFYVFHEQYEIPLYHVAVSDVPEHEDEVNAVNFWIGKDEGILGMQLFHTPDDLTYSRLWEHDSDTWLAPAKCTETINLDAYGTDTTRVEHLGTMLYARTVEGLTGEIDEYLFTTVERDDDGFRVRIWVGLPLAQADIELPDAI